jgi:hypothetical protein
VYTQGSPIEIQTPKQWNSHSITTLLPILLPTSIIIPPLLHSDFFLSRKNLAQIKKNMYYFSYLKLLKWSE